MMHLFFTILSQELLERQETHPISDTTNYTKTLGLEWNTSLDQFNLIIAEFTSPESITKRALVSDVAKVFDIMGWFSPTVITMKILLQRLWELRLDWDDFVPDHIKQTWDGELSYLILLPVPFLVVTFQEIRLLSQCKYMASVMPPRMRMLESCIFVL